MFVTRSYYSKMDLESTIFSTELNDLPLFQQFYINASSKLGENRKSRRIFDIRNDVFYLCDTDSGDIYVSRTLSFAKTDTDHKFQVYTPIERFKGNLLDISASDRIDVVALITDMGLYIANLPHVRTICMLATVPYINNYSTWHVLPMEFKMHSAFVYELQRALWHPRQENQLYVLFNDNYLRLYDVVDKSLLNIISLGCHPYHPLSTIYALGEGVIDFDYLPFRDDDEEDPTLLVTRGDGIIFKVILTLKNRFIYSSSDIQIMPKNSHDNSNFHFVDSMIVLPSKPATVVFTHRTNIYHCFYLEMENKEFLIPVEKCEVSAANRDGTHYSLKLIKDTSYSFRYFILHGFGLHAVLIPLASLLTDTFTSLTSSIDNDKMVELLNTNVTESKVIHLVASSDSCPLIPGQRGLFGVAVMPGRNTSSTLIIMDPEYCVLSLKTDQLMTPQAITFKHVDPSSKDESFREKINGILNPPHKKRTLLKYDEKKMLAKIYGKSLNKPPDKILEELRKLGCQLKAVHIHSQEEAMTAINLKAQELLFEEIFQGKQLEALICEKEHLKSSAERIAEKYEELNDRLIMQHKRFDVLNLKIQGPITSMADEKMKKGVQLYHEKYLTLEKSLCQANHTLNLMNNTYHSRLMRTRQICLDQETKKCLHKDLTEMYDQIKSVMGRIKHLLNCIKATDGDTAEKYIFN